MFCENCGKPIEPGSTFCETCGTRVGGDPAPEAPEAPVETMPAVCGNCGAPIEEGCTFCAVCGTPVGEAVEAAKPAGLKSKLGGLSKFITKKVAIIAVAAVVGVGIVAKAYPYIENFCMKTFASPGSYFGYVIANNIDDTASIAGEAWDIYRDMFVDGVTVKETVKYESGEGLKDLIDDIGGGAVDTDAIDWVHNATVEGKAQAKGGQMKADLDFKVNGKDLGKFSYAFDFEAGEIYFGTPDYNDKYLQISGGGVGDTEIIPKLAAALPDGKKVEKIVKRYAKVVTKNVKDVKKSSATITADGVSQKATKLEVSIDGDTVRDVGIAVLEELRDDKDIKKIVEDVADAVDEDTPEMEDAIDDLIDDLEDAEFGDEEVDFDLYINGKGELVGFEMEVEGEGIEIFTTESGGKFGVEARISMDGADVSIEGGGKQFAGKRSGNFALKVMGVEIIEVETKSIDVSKAKKGVFDGKMTIRVSDDAKGIAKKSGASIPSEIFDLSIVIESSSSSMKNGKAEVALMYGDAVCFKASAKVNISGSGKVKMPTNYIDATDEDDLEEWLDGFDKEKLIDRLKKIGLPDDAMDAVEEGLDY